MKKGKFPIVSIVIKNKTNEFKKRNQYHYNIINNYNKQREFKKNRSILIVREQGVGDEILFSSIYNDLIKNNLSKIKIECDKRLLEIFNRSFNKNIFYPFGHYSSSNKTLQEFDNILYAGSLTKYFRNEESNLKIEPYIKTSDKLDKKFNLILKKFNDKKKIGISWKSVFNIFGSLKSLELNHFEKLYTQGLIRNIRLHRSKPITASKQQKNSTKSFADEARIGNRYSLIVKF